LKGLLIDVQSFFKKHIFDNPWFTIYQTNFEKTNDYSTNMCVLSIGVVQFLLELRPVGTKSINNKDYKASVKSLLILLKVSKIIPTTYNKENYFVRILTNGINLNIESLLVWR
jgi:hypothetical protein